MVFLTGVGAVGGGVVSSRRMNVSKTNLDTSRLLVNGLRPKSYESDETVMGMSRLMQFLVVVIVVVVVVVVVTSPATIGFVAASPDRRNVNGRM